MMVVLTFVQNVFTEKKFLWMLHFFENGSLGLLERFS